jgi:HJR/Mrr/RecB family endonuclease
MIDTAVLHLSIEAHVAHVTKKAIPVVLHWRAIQLDQPGRIPKDEAVKVLHIDVAREHQTIAKQALEEIYSSKQVYWPLHI